MYRIYIGEYRHGSKTLRGVYAEDEDGNSRLLAGAHREDDEAAQTFSDEMAIFNAGALAAGAGLLRHIRYSDGIIHADDLRIGK